MAQKAELVIDSKSVVKTTEALDNLIDRLEKLATASGKTDSGGEKLKNNQTKIKNALDQTNISQEKAIALMKLERKGLDSTSSQYAKLKAEILAKEVAAKKGIKTGTEEYNQLLKNTKAKELATAKTKQLSAANKALRKQQKNATTSTKSFTNALDDAAKQASLVDGPLGGVASRITTLSSILKNAGGAAGLAIAGLGVASALTFREIFKGLGVAADAEVQMKTFEAQVLATGGAAGYTAEQLDILARSLAMSTLNNRQGVSEIISVMTTFKNVSNEAFTRAIALSQDFGIALKTNATSAARTLGKVLENPIDNYKQLSRAGLEFDKDEKDRMQRAQQLGNIYEAQTIILDKLAGKFGEVAESQADTLRGDIDTFGQLWEETFERVGAKLLPLSRDIVQLGVSWLEFSQEIEETDVETTFRQWKKGFLETLGDIDKSKATLGELEAEYAKLGDTSKEELGLMQEAWVGLKGVLDKVPAFALSGVFEVDSDDLTDNQQAAELLKKQIEYTKETIEAKGKATVAQKGLTEQQEDYLEGLALEFSQQEKLTKAFKATGDTRSDVYVKAKAGVDAENAAKKVGLELDEDRKKEIQQYLVKISQLTEQRVKYNTVIQKEKSLNNQQRLLEREIELYSLVQSGLSKNSDEYIRASATITARNTAIAASIELGSEEHKQIEDATLALEQLTKKRKILSELESSDENSNKYLALKTQIELQDLLNQGIKENTEEYFLASAEIETRNVALSKGIDLGSAEYEQLLKQNKALAAMRNQLQQVSNLREVGLTQDSFGKVIVENTRQSILAEVTGKRSILTELLSAGKIDKELFDQKIEEYKSYFNTGLKSLTIPLGITVDESGKEVLLSSVEAVEVEKQEKLKELKLAYENNVIQDLETFKARQLEIEKEYLDKETEAKIEAYKKTREYKNAMLSAEVADQAAAGLETLSVVAGNNKELARLAKLSAMFSASVGLVELLNTVSTDKTMDFYTKLAAYAGAFAQGTNIISMASGLNEPSFAFGGVDIEGSGTGRSDGIKANIARGESVITAPATSMYKDTLRRMNAGLPINNVGSSSSIISSPKIIIQGDASEKTVQLIEDKLRDYEQRVEKISQGVSLTTIQQENQVGGFLNPL